MSDVHQHGVQVRLGIPICSDCVRTRPWWVWTLRPCSFNEHAEPGNDIHIAYYEKPPKHVIYLIARLGKTNEAAIFNMAIR